MYELNESEKREEDIRQNIFSKEIIINCSGTQYEDLVEKKLSYYKEKKIKVSFRLYLKPEYFFEGFVEDIKSFSFTIKLENKETAYLFYADISPSSIHPSSINPIKYFDRLNIPEWKKKLVFERCNYLCELKLEGCTNKVEEIDHWIPISKGGSDDICNLRGSCSHCNKTKSNKIL